MYQAIKNIPTQPKNNSFLEPTGQKKCITLNWVPYMSQILCINVFAAFT